MNCKSLAASFMAIKNGMTLLMDGRNSDAFLLGRLAINPQESPKIHADLNPQ
ncbi:MAG: hypothetical protein AAGA75_19910 [Cyanobacteria bacterium P01_E01_bin.6]